MSRDWNGEAAQDKEEEGTRTLPTHHVSYQEGAPQPRSSEMNSKAAWQAAASPGTTHEPTTSPSRRELNLKVLVIGSGSSPAE